MVYNNLRLSIPATVSLGPLRFSFFFFSFLICWDKTTSDRDVGHRRKENVENRKDQVYQPLSYHSLSQTEGGNSRCSLPLSCIISMRLLSSLTPTFFLVLKDTSSYSFFLSNALGTKGSILLIELSIKVNFNIMSLNLPLLTDQPEFQTFLSEDCRMLFVVQECHVGKVLLLMMDL